MNTSLDRMIAVQVDEFVAGKIETRELVNFLAPLVWDAEEFDESTKYLIYSLELLIAEFAQDHLSLSELKQKAADLCAYNHIVTGASNTTTSCFSVIPA